MTEEPTDTAPEPTRYWGNVLNSFENGVQLDLRVKLAVDFLKAGILSRPEQLRALSPAPPPDDTGFMEYQHPQNPAAFIAGFALDLATELLAQADARGLVKEIPEDDGLSAALRRQIRRSARAQVYGQVAQQEVVREEAPQVMQAPAGLARQ